MPQCPRLTTAQANRTTKQSHAQISIYLFCGQQCNDKDDMRGPVVVIFNRATYALQLRADALVLTRAMADWLALVMGS